MNEEKNLTTEETFALAVQNHEKSKKIENLRIFDGYIFGQVLESKILLQSVKKQKSLI